jgi:hypothetical protein
MPSELDVYQPPKSDIAAAGATQGKLYTPPQVGVASFLGGPIAGCLLLASNYAALERPSARIQAIVWGLVATAATLALALVLPERFPNTAIPIAYTAALYNFAKYTQDKTYVDHLAAAGRQPYWKVITIGVASLVAVLVVLGAYFWFFGD